VVSWLSSPERAGKTTLVNLLLRFWEYAEDRSFWLADLRSYRKMMCAVDQPGFPGHVLFNATVRENLLIARPDATEDDLTQAARQAQIRLHPVPARRLRHLDRRTGSALSGGERQRLAIARALLKDAPC